MAVRFGHVAELQERLLPGVALEIRKAAGSEHPLIVYSGCTFLAQSVPTIWGPIQSKV